MKTQAGEMLSSKDISVVQRTQDQFLMLWGGSQPPISPALGTSDASSLHRHLHSHAHTHTQIHIYIIKNKLRAGKMVQQFGTLL